jgi:hypothetical protein
VYGRCENIVVDRARHQILRLAIFTVRRAHPARDGGQSHAPCAGAPRRTSGACAATHGRLMANMPALTPRARPRAKAQQPQAPRLPRPVSRTPPPSCPPLQSIGSATTNSPLAPNRGHPTAPTPSRAPSKATSTACAPAGRATTGQSEPRRAHPICPAAGARRNHLRPGQSHQSTQASRSRRPGVLPGRARPESAAGGEPRAGRGHIAKGEFFPGAFP